MSTPSQPSPTNLSDELWRKYTYLWTSGGSLRIKLQEYAHRYADAATRSDQEAFTDALIAAITAAYAEAIRNAVPEKKKLETDLDEDNIGGFEDPHKFCVECGQYEIEGALECQCVGFNAAIDTFTANLQKERLLPNNASDGGGAL